MKTKRLERIELWDYVVSSHMVVFQRFDDPVVDMGVLSDVSLMDNQATVQSFGHEKILSPLEDYVFYSLEVDGEGISETD